MKSKKKTQKNNNKYNNNNKVIKMKIHLKIKLQAHKLARILENHK